MTSFSWSNEELLDGTRTLGAYSRYHRSVITVKVLPDGQRSVELKVTNRASLEPERCVRGLSIDPDQVEHLIEALQAIAMETCFALDCEEQIAPTSNGSNVLAAVGAASNARLAFPQWLEEERKGGYLRE